MFARGKRGRHSISKLKRLDIPKYTIPRELHDALDKNFKICPAISIVAQNYIEVLKVLRKVECLDITENHYARLMKFALYLEGKQADKNIKSETLTDISVDNHDERLRTIHMTNKKFCGNSFQNYPLRYAHYALELMYLRDTIKYLFPHESFVTNAVDDCSDSQLMIYRNLDIARNAEQIQAITNIVKKSSFPVPYILYGPPGTGKTATLVEAICQIHDRNPYTHVLVCTPSNTAADEITKRLLDFLSPDSVFRMYSRSKEGSTIDEKMQSCANIANDKVVLLEREELIRKRIVITTSCNSIRLHIMRIPADHFSYVIIDEAGQGTEPDTLIPISLISGNGLGNGRLCSQIVFAGDPQQLGPTVISKLAHTILGRSILERLMSYDMYKKGIDNKYNPKYITKLLENYRSHPDILHISNKLFYENELIAKGARNDGQEKFPVVFHGYEGKEEKDHYSHSVCNVQEVKLVVGYVNTLLKYGMGFGAFTVEDIGIVTPFTFQTEKIQVALKEKKIKGINVGTVDSFQGQERKVIIITTVRSKTFIHEGKEHMGHLSDPKRLNVAVTRAKNLLLIVGNPKVLQMDKNWRYLLTYCIENKSYTGTAFTLNDSSENESDVNSNLVKSTALFDNLSLPL